MACVILHHFVLTRKQEYFWKGNKLNKAVPLILAKKKLILATSVQEGADQ
jgi:hypothetical protein